MPSSSSRLNIKYLENSDEKDSGSDSHSSPPRATNIGDTAKNSSHHYQKEKVDRNELSNDGSNDTSDSDNTSPEQRELFTSVNGPQSLQMELSSEMPNAETSASSFVSHFENGAAVLPATESLPGTLDDADSLVDDKQISKTGLQKTFFCKICHQGFTRKHNMVSHELIHTSQKVHRCQICNTTFRRVHDLKRHEKLHTGEKPFQCDRCHRHFARTDALARHLNSPNACTGNLIRGMSNDDNSPKDVIDGSVSSNLVQDTNSNTAVLTVFPSERRDDAVPALSTRVHGQVVLAVSESNSSTLLNASNTQNSSNSESTKESSNLATPGTKADNIKGPSRLEMPPNQNSSVPSSSLSSGSIELSRYELNKWSSNQYYKENEKNINEDGSQDSNEVRSDVSSGVDSTESSGGHIPIRNSPVMSSGCNDFPKRTTTTTTTTTMEQGGRPLSQNYIQRFSQGRNEPALRLGNSDRHFYHHIHYYHHVHNYDGPAGGPQQQRGQYIAHPGGSTVPGTELSHERHANFPNSAHRVLHSEGQNNFQGPPLPFSKRLISNEPNYEDYKLGELPNRNVYLERSEHPGGVPQFLSSSADRSKTRKPAEAPFTLRRQNEIPHPNPHQLIQKRPTQGNDAPVKQPPAGFPLQGRQPHLEFQPQQQQARSYEQPIQRQSNEGLSSSSSQQRTVHHGRDQERPSGKRSFVSAEKYENLMNYASNLQNSLSTLEDRLIALEGKNRGSRSSSSNQKGAEKRSKKAKFEARQSEGNAMAFNQEYSRESGHDAEDNIASNQSNN